MSAENKALARRMEEDLFGAGLLELIPEIIASTYVAHDPASPPVEGHEGLKQYMQIYRTAFPDLHFTILDQLSEGDKVLTRWTASGTHTGPLASPGGAIPPTGKPMTVPGMSLSVIAGGKLVEEWHYWDALGLFHQLGLA
jgi:predicted ester cyclase